MNNKEKLRLHEVHQSVSKARIAEFMKFRETEKDYNKGAREAELALYSIMGGMEWLEKRLAGAPAEHTI